MFQSIGAVELLIVVLVVVLIFGSRKIPNLVRSLGEALKEFKKAAKDSD